MAKVVVRRPGVLAQTGKSTSQLYADMADELFPRPIKIGPRAVAWLQDEIDEWLEARIAERDQASV